MFLIYVSRIFKRTKSDYSNFGSISPLTDFDCQLARKSQLSLLLLSAGRGIITLLQQQTTAYNSFFNFRNLSIFTNTYEDVSSDTCIFGCKFLKLFIFIFASGKIAKKVYLKMQRRYLSNLLATVALRIVLSCTVANLHSS